MGHDSRLRIVGLNCCFLPTGRNFEAVIQNHYGDTFGMTKEQKDKFKEIRKEQADEKEKAKQELAEKIQKIYKKPDSPYILF